MSDRKAAKSREQLVEAIGAAIASHPSSSEDPINEEHLALLCEGEIDALSEKDRERLLRQIAAESWAAELVNDLHDSLGAKAHGDVAGTILRIAPWAWAVAAGVLLAIGAWRMAQPPVAADTQTAIVAQPPGHPLPQVPETFPQANISEGQKPPAQGHFVDVLPATQGTANVQQNGRVPDAGVTPLPEAKPERSARDIAFVAAAIVLVLLTPLAVFGLVARRQIRMLNVENS